MLNKKKNVIIFVLKYGIFKKLYGLDFMITENLKPLLIEVNLNPCLELSCALL